MKQIYTTILGLFLLTTTHAQFELATPAFYLVADSAKNHEVKNAYNDEPKSVYGRLDTLKFYDVELETETYRNRTTYWVDHKEVDKTTYDYYDFHWKNVDRCTPCYLKTYDKNERLLKEGVQYGDCNIGKWIEYNLAGTIKIRGYFKENSTGDWEKIWLRGLCTVKHGRWSFFDEHGSFLYEIHYDNGIEIDQP